MQYRSDRTGTPLSVLGYGCMRFTRKGNAIDLDKAEQQLLAAYEAGVNYYDTAYIYPGSEAALGEILERNHLREKVFVADKLPQYLVRSRAGLEKYFQEQLSRLRTDYIDFYLMHHMTDVAMWEKLKDADVIAWIDEKKKSGQIRRIGFSYHGNSEHFLEILNAYDWDFCQIQYNYLDEVSQAGRIGLEAAAAKGIPVIIMEPLRGGRLVNALPAEAKAAMQASGRAWSAAEWGLRWLYDQPGVTVVLSGMNSREMVLENCRIADEATPGCLTDDDQRVLADVCRAIRAGEKVGCTGCRYCMPCPQGVDIPGIFRCWNALYTDGKKAGRKQFMQTVALTKQAAFASQCVGCGKCEKHCPQSIPIREKLKEADKELMRPSDRLLYGTMRTILYKIPAKRKKENA